MSLISSLILSVPHSTPLKYIGWFVVGIFDLSATSSYPTTGVTTFGLRPPLVLLYSALSASATTASIGASASAKLPPVAPLPVRLNHWL